MLGGFSIHYQIEIVPRYAPNARNIPFSFPAGAVLRRDSGCFRMT